MSLPALHIQPIPGMQNLPAWAHSDKCQCGHDHHAIYSNLIPFPPSAQANRLEDLILASTIRSQNDLVKMTKAQTAALVKELKTAEKEILQSIKDLEFDPTAGAKGFRLSRLEALKSNIDSAIEGAKNRQSLLMYGQTEEAFKNGIKGSVDHLNAMDAPNGWGALGTAQIGEAAAGAFAVIDKAALGFWSTYRLELAGAVSDQLKNDIKTALSSAVVQGKPLYEVTRQLGHVVKDPAAFREAGVWTEKGFSRQIFPSACNRLQLIVDTESNRIHNQGRLAFYDDVGINRVRWLISPGRNCDYCLSLENEVFDIDKVPIIPAHPGCHCLVVGEPNLKMKSADKYIARFDLKPETAADKAVLKKPVIKATPTKEQSRPGMIGNKFHQDVQKIWRDSKNRPASEKIAGRMTALRVPPAWTDVQLSADVNAALQAVGLDSKGRMQYRYSAEHAAKQAAEKFDRLKAFNSKLPEIRKKIVADMKSADPAKKEAASVLRLIDKTGFRHGSMKETGAKIKAFGATTLRAEHAIIVGDKVTFDFVGKKGVNIVKTVEDKELARMLKPRVAQGGQLFDVTDAGLRDYLHQIGGKQFKVKDFRTWNGTDKALQKIYRMEMPTTEKQFLESQKEVCKAVSEHLGNTPAVAKSSYIDPAAWRKWETAIAKGAK